jgi:peptidoglycan/xylan/chitin deacetylase (PgdA/CDA1 family)
VELWSELGIPIRIFVPTGLIGEQLANSKVAEVRQLEYWNSIQNVGLASHSHSHVNLTRLSRTQRLKELQVSKTIVEDITGSHCNEIAYPRGRYTSEVLEDVVQSGYKTGWTTKQGTVEHFNSPNLEQSRFAIHNYTTPKEIAGRISVLSLFIESRIIRK